MNEPHRKNAGHDKGTGRHEKSHEVRKKPGMGENQQPGPEDVKEVEQGEPPKDTQPGKPSGMP